MKIRWLDRGMLFSPHVAVCVSEAEFTAVKQRFSLSINEPYVDENGFANVRNVQVTGGATVCIVCLNTTKLRSLSRTDVSSTLVHEAVHVYQNWLHSIDTAQDDVGMEIQAYCIENLYMHLQNAWDSSKATQRKKKSQQRQ